MMMETKVGQCSSTLDYEELSEVMLKPSEQFSHFHGGLTYFGQIIVHDLIPPRGKVTGEFGQYPYALNLNSLYGFEPDYKYELFPEQTSFLDENGCFLFDCNRDWDVLRTDVGKAKIPEPRNDENIIIAQLHRIFQKFHNKLIEGGYVCNALEARRVVTKVFHTLVIEYFLKSVLDDRIYIELFYRNTQLIPVSSRTIPNFFSHAAMRFGHSMVREMYDLNDKKQSVDLKELFKRGEALDEEWKIDWNNLFGEERFSTAEPIDTYIAKDMGHIPLKLDCKRAETFNIVKLNLEAGDRAGLRNGSEFVDAYLNSENGGKLRYLGLTFVGNTEGSTLDQLPDIYPEELPLWPYLLLEAEKQKEGKELGVLGSLMVGQVLKQALINSRYSILEKEGYSLSLMARCLPEKVREDLGLEEGSPIFDINNVIRFTDKGVKK